MEPLASPEAGRNLAPTAFTSPEVFELEQRQIFAKSWIHVADLDDVPAPGSFIAAQIGRTPVVILRDRDGVLRGFVNACRHRGAQLVEGKGTCDKQIKCSYHAWSYALDGALVGVPYRDQFAHCAHELDAMSLVPVRVGTCGPLIFACLDADAPPLAEWLGDLPGAIAHAHGWKLGYELHYELAANWKLFVENANDGYHVQFVHDILTDAIVMDPNVTRTTLEPHGAHTWAQINPNYVPPDRDIADARIRFGSIFPNLIPGPNLSALCFSSRCLKCFLNVGASGSISTMSIAPYGHACAHAVQPVQVDSLITTSLRSSSNLIESYAHGSMQRWSVHVRHV